MTEKEISLRDHPDICIQIHELLDPDFGCYLWPSAMAMASIIHSISHPGQRILELGAGIGLPGLLLGKMGNKVMLTDSEEYTQVLSNLRRAVSTNDLDLVCEVMPLTWGHFNDPAFDVVEKGYDLIIGCDVLYDPSSFESLFATVKLILNYSPGARFLTTYQERSSKRNVDGLLERWGLTGKSVPFDFFSEVEERLVLKVNGSQVPYTDPGLGSVFLLEIWSQ